jgi:hypothetical protein
VSERPAGAEFLLLVVEPEALPVVAVPLEPVAALVVEPEAVPVVPVLLDPVADDECEDDEGDGLGHKFLYTN